MKISKVSHKSIVSMIHFYILTGIILLLISCQSLYCERIQTSDTDNFTKKDSIVVSQDSLKQIMLTDYHNYRFKKQLGFNGLNWLKYDIKFMKRFKPSKVMDHELITFSRDLYIKYYMNRIELFNYKKSVYFYLNLKEAQTSQGALQLRIQLPSLKSSNNKSKNRD